MGSAQDCPSKQLGLCKTINQGVKCYAEKAEIQYKENVLNYRHAQESYWKSTSGSEILSRLIRKLESRRKETTYFRFNESGDFYCQADVEKLNFIARGLREAKGITTYGYTARSDLDFRTCEFLCKGSGFNGEGLNGSTEVILKEQQVPEGYIECPGSCKKCNLCKIAVPHNIAFRKH
jgi:hypothetical protein